MRAAELVVKLPTRHWRKRVKRRKLGQTHVHPPSLRGQLARARRGTMARCATLLVACLALSATSLSGVAGETHSGSVACDKGWWYEQPSGECRPIAFKDRFRPAKTKEYVAAVDQMWNVLDRIAMRWNFGCVDKSPFSNPKTLCAARGDRFNPYVFGYIRPSQRDVYERHLVQQRRSLARESPQVYCEIGMNAGHGTVAALLTSRTLQVHSFDMQEWGYSDAVAEFIRTVFPGRFHNHSGSSFENVPAFAQNAAMPPCDAALIDGAHYKAGVSTDLANMRAAMQCDHVLFIDDLQTEVGGVVDAMVETGTLEILEKHAVTPDDPAACMRIYERNRLKPGEARWWPTKMMPLEDVDRRWTLVEKCGFEPFAFAVARYKGLAHCPRIN